MEYSSIGLFFVILYLTIPLGLYILQKLAEPSPDEIYRRKRTIVLVLGDLARSPRMLNHARSLAQGGLDVDLCGYDEGNRILPEIANSPRIAIHRIPVIKNASNLPFALFAVRKVLEQHIILVKLLWKLRGADFLLVQNPPSIPTLGVARLFVVFLSRRTKLVIDWHNLGYSILALKFNKKTSQEQQASAAAATAYDEGQVSNHPFVSLYKWYEKFFGYHAYCHFTVTVRMGEVLRRRFKMKAKRILPLYDRPALQFHPLSFDEKIAVINAHSNDIFEGLAPATQEKIIITSTSYTPDEDIYMLLDALLAYDKRKTQLDFVGPTVNGSSNGSIGSNGPLKKKQRQLPKLRVIITGKGPMLEEIQTYISEKLEPALAHVRIFTPWLAAEDYPKVLGTADIGVSLHMSSSGVDLPMKAVDMFGVGVPVVSVSYPALSELIQEKINGLYVKNSKDIAASFETLFLDDELYDQIKAGAMRESRIKWDHEWNKKVGPLFGIGEYRQRDDDEISESSSSSSSGF